MLLLIFFFFSTFHGYGEILCMRASEKNFAESSPSFSYGIKKRNAPPYQLSDLQNFPMASLPSELDHYLYRDQTTHILLHFRKR